MVNLIHHYTSMINSANLIQILGCDSVLYEVSYQATGASGQPANKGHCSPSTERDGAAIRVPRCRDHGGDNFQARAVPKHRATCTRSGSAPGWLDRSQPLARRNPHAFA